MAPTSDDGEGWTWHAPGARAVFTSRGDGNLGLHVGDDADRVLERRRAVAVQRLGLDASSVAGVTQVHGADVWVDLGAGEELAADVRWDRGPSPVEADALVTNRLGVALAVGVADCMPIAVAWGDAIAAIHAGWRSLEAGVIEATMTVLRRAAESSVALAGVRPYAVIGPSLGPCCFEVGEEVAARFDPAAVVRRPGASRPFLDARADATRCLELAGCLVELIDVCTSCDARLFSHRADGEHGGAGRQALLVARD